MKKIFIFLFSIYLNLFAYTSYGFGWLPTSSVLLYASNGHTYYYRDGFNVINFYGCSTTVLPAYTYKFSSVFNSASNILLLSHSPDDPNCPSAFYQVAYSDDLGTDCGLGYTFDPNTFICTPPAPTCPEHEHFDSNNQCVCNVGYNDSSTSGSCVPDLDCPSPMVYSVKSAWHGLWAYDKKCSPDANMSKSQCDNVLGATFLDPHSSDEKISLNALIYGSGCTYLDYSKSLYINDSVHNIIGFMLFAPMWDSSKDILVRSLNKLFSSGKNAFKSILDKFKNSSSSPSPTFTNSKVDIIDMQIGSDGVSYEVDLSPKSPPTDPNNLTDIQSFKDTYDEFLKNGWDLPPTYNSYDPVVNDPLPPSINVPDFPTPPVNDADLLYQGGDSLTFDDNHLATYTMSKGGSVPDLVPLHNSTLNQSVNTNFNIIKGFATPTLQNYPAIFSKIESSTLSDRVSNKYVGHVSFPDGTKTNLVIHEDLFPDGHSVVSVVTHTPIHTTNGVIKDFKTSYVTDLDINGASTNHKNFPSSVSHSDDSGSVVSSTNSPGGDSVVTDSTSPSIDLTSLNNRLDSINAKIKQVLNTPIPESINTASESIGHFTTASNVFDVNFNSYYNFLNGINTNISDLKTNFENAKATLENKPTINEINGQCGFDSNFYGTPVHVDPCMFISPYRPFLSVIFTLFGTFGVLSFSVKYLIAKGD